MLIELIKLAYTLDAKGEYAISAEVDQIVAELAQRAGLSKQEVVALANYLDEAGENKMADKLDNLIAKKKPNPGHPKSGGTK